MKKNILLRRNIYDSRTDFYTGASTVIETGCLASTVAEYVV